MKNGPVTKYNAQGEVVYGRQLDEPKQYTQGFTEFYKLKFKVTPDVLIPRPETELLVDEVLKYLRSSSPLGSNKKFVVLDVGTGSGAIAVSVAKNAPEARVFAVDISAPALEIARENAKKNRVENKIFFMESDLLANFQIGSAKMDVIVANLPYIPTGRIDFLDPSVKDFEPYIALNGGYDGFELYRRLFDQMNFKNLIPALFVGEIDEEQEKIALEEAKKYFPKAKNIEIKKDLAKKPRILVIEF